MEMALRSGCLRLGYVYLQVLICRKGIGSLFLKFWIRLLLTGKLRGSRSGPGAG